MTQGCLQTNYIIKANKTIKLWHKDIKKNRNTGKTQITEINHDNWNILNGWGHTDPADTHESVDPEILAHNNNKEMHRSLCL